MVDIFTHTSVDAYDRHQYKIYYYNNKSKILDYYDDVHAEWALGSVKLIEVIDKKVKTKNNKGFK